MLHATNVVESASITATAACKMSQIPSNHLTATETAALVRSGKLTVVELARAHVERYSQRNADVEAWAFIDEQRILAEAERLDAVPREKRGPLHGLILGVKDMIRTFRYSAPKDVREPELRRQKRQTCPLSMDPRCTRTTDPVWTLVS